MSSITVFADGTTAVNDTTVGSFNWTDPGNVGANDSNHATIGTTGTSYYLRVAPNSLAAIPSGATIDGIEISVEQGANGPGADTNSARVYKSGTGYVGTDRQGDDTDDWYASYVAVYGGASELWGTTWTRDEVVNNLQFAISCTTPNTATRRIDYISFTIYYTAGTAWAVVVNDSLVFGGSGSVNTGFSAVVNDSLSFGGTGVLNKSWSVVVNDALVYGGTGVLNKPWMVVVNDSLVYGGTGSLNRGWNPTINDSLVFGGTGTISRQFSAVVNDSLSFGGTGTLVPYWIAADSATSPTWSDADGATSPTWSDADTPTTPTWSDS